jgi:antitoxin component HigA of HigAB toxin-antitoxin module
MKKWQGVLEKNEFILNDLRYSIFSKTNMSNILSKGACVTLEEGPTRHLWLLLLAWFV